MVAIIDYGVGNLFSLISSLHRIGVAAEATSDPQTIRAADKLILPGVGAFADAIEKLRRSGLDTLIRKQAAGGKDILGVCLGMQLLFEKSCEYGEHEGLGLLKGSVVPMQGVIPKNLKIPHIGWNALHIRKPSALLRRIQDGDYVYFVHSYYASDCADSVIATAEYGAQLTAAVEAGNIKGCQFHPEKSGEVGLNILRAFCREGET